MAKLRVIGNRFGFGSWGVPFSRGRNASLEERSKSHSSASFPPGTGTLSQIPPSPVPKSTASTSKLLELAQIISRETEKLDSYLKANGHPEPTFDVDAPSHFPKLSGELKKSREDVMRATKELGELVAGPSESVRWMAWDVSFSSQKYQVASILMYFSITIHFLCTQFTSTN